MAESFQSALAFDYGPVLAGAVSALVLSWLLRVRAVALLVATAIAGVLIWAIVGEEAQPAALFDLAAARLGELVSTGFLTGMLLANGAVSLIRGLVRTASGKDRRRRG